MKEVIAWLKKSGIVINPSMTEVEYSSFQGLLNTTVASIDLSDMKLKNP